MSKHFLKGQEPDFPARILRGHLPSLICDCDGESENFFSFITAIKHLAASGENSASQVVLFFCFVFFPTISDRNFCFNPQVLSLLKLPGTKMSRFLQLFAA